MASNDVEKYCICAWSILVTILSSMGNCAVLVATIKYDAIKIDKISKVLRNIVTLNNLDHFSNDRNYRKEFTVL